MTSSPETIDEALDHGRIIRNAERAGLCLPCAVMFGNGTQLGFERVGDPCDPCLAVMAHWPVKRVNGWRTIPGRVARSISWSDYTN